MREDNPNNDFRSYSKRLRMFPIKSYAVYRNIDQSTAVSFYDQRLEQCTNAALD